MPIIAAPLYAAGIALLAIMFMGLLVLESINRERAHALAVGLLVTAAFCFFLDRVELSPRTVRLATPAPGMPPAYACEHHPSPNPSEKVSSPKFLKIKSKPKTFSAPYGTMLLRAGSPRGLMNSSELNIFYKDRGYSCRDADHALECACSPADKCSNAPR